VKANNAIARSASVTALLTLCACGGGESGMVQAPASMPAPMATSQTLTTGDVLARARVESETGDPFAVDDDLVKVSQGEDDGSDPVTVE